MFHTFLIVAFFTSWHPYSLSLSPDPLLSRFTETHFRLYISSELRAELHLFQRTVVQMLLHSLSDWENWQSPFQVIHFSKSCENFSLSGSNITVLASISPVHSQQISYWGDFFVYMEGILILPLLLNNSNLLANRREWLCVCSNENQDFGFLQTGWVSNRW